MSCSFFFDLELTHPEVGFFDVNPHASREYFEIVFKDLLGRRAETLVLTTEQIVHLKNALNQELSDVIVGF